LFVRINYGISFLARSGWGRRLFESMLADQSKEETGISHPREMAIDRPSPKLLAFLKKFYGLTNVIPQVRKK